MADATQLLQKEGFLFLEEVHIYLCRCQAFLPWRVEARPSAQKGYRVELYAIYAIRTIEKKTVKEKQAELVFYSKLYVNKLLLPVRNLYQKTKTTRKR